MVTAPKTTATRQFAGLVLVRIDPGKLAELRLLLDEVGRQTIALMQGRPPADVLVPFQAIETIHYARFVLIDQDAESGPLPEPMLAFSTNYDGPEGEPACSASRALSHHIAELVRVASPGLERIFQCCRGYRQGQLAAYLAQNQRKASTFYVGASGRSRNQILWEAGLRRRVDGILDAGPTVSRDANRSAYAQPAEPAELGGPWAGWAPEAVRGEVLKQLGADYPGIPTFPPQPDLGLKVKAFKSAIWTLALLVVGAATVVAWREVPVADVFLQPTPWHRAVRGGTALVVALLALAAPILFLLRRFRIREQTDPQFQPKFSEDVHQRFRVASADENHFLQNQLTHLVPIKPGVLRWLLIRVVFLALQVLATNQYNKGKLGGIPSIHFARWVLLPNRGVLFFSNFDSSWQSYLGDFIDQASSGLTAVWSNTVGYPRTTWLVTAGSRDASRFLAWTRHHQLPTQVWYCAYPGLSIVNVNANTEIRRGLADREAIDATTWLFRLRGVDRLETDQLFSEETTREAPLSLKNIQGIILKGYGQMPEARFLMFRVRDSAPSADLLAWLSELPVTSAEAVSRDVDPPEPFLNVAFSHRGLRALGIDEALCARFSTPFVQGSDDEYRARVNGDVGASAPDRWAWGSAQAPVHVVLLVYAKGKDTLATFVEQYTRAAESRGLALVQSLEGTTLPGRKEHFGFRDGIAQPIIQGSGRAEVGGNTIAAGEILLGHRDGYGNVSDSPASSAGFAFGYNGSYLVLRQLEQNVEAFWRYCADANRSAAVTIASKMVGRWPSGASLVRHPKQDPDSDRFMDEDDFTYLGNDADNDRYGARCPFGAHIRRANPRDWHLGGTPEESLELSNLHRIIRRGRPYGPPLDPELDAAKMIERARTSGASQPEARGLQFLCFNASLDRQFEFIQQQWLNNPKFAGLNSDADPLLGNQCPVNMLGTDAPSFAIQSDVKTDLIPRATGIQNFCRVVGSGYFFMPSLLAVRLLRFGLRRASAADELESPPPDEQLHIDGLINSLREKMKRDYTGGTMLRDAHPKMHGCVQARFTIEANIDASLKLGLFGTAHAYHAWVRFSNQDGTVSPDTKRDIRGVAIKLMDVPGAKLLDGEEDCTTHDFILISHDAFVTRDVAEFDALIKAMVARSKWSLPRFLLGHPRVAYNLARSLKKHSSPLEIQYFSVAPYLFGTRAVKYTLRPSSDEQTPIPAQPSPNYLREALKARLRKGSASFDFMVQLRGDPAKMPIEDPGVAWRESDAKFQKVATLEIPMQDFDTPARQLFGENLSFNPWRCLPEHRPLGGISRARRQVYRALSSFRHDRNATPREEPS